MKEVCENPTAKIAVKKNVVKVYEIDKVNKVFLKDGTEFEIELFNPTKDVVLCKFKLNGKFTNDGGLVLNPGQRVFLERYLDESKKFVFETYTVDNTPEALQAIYDNGSIEISFYKEIANNWTVTQTSGNGWSYSGNYFYYNSRGAGGFVPTTTTNIPSYDICNAQKNIGATGVSGSSGTLGVSCCTETPATFYSNTSNTKLGNSDVIKVSCNTKREEKETGRIEKGSNSGQVLTYVDKYFSSYAFHKVSIKILPDNEKIYEADDLKHKKYCPECGSKLKPTDKFCSQCGHKI